MAGELNAQQLDALAASISKINFSLDGSNVNEFAFDVKRRGNSLVFKHGNISVTVRDFSFVDWDKWSDTQYPAVDRTFIQYLYKAEVNAQVNNTKVEGTITLGYWRDREKLLAPLARGMERDVVDNLLSKIDKICMAIFPLETASNADRKHNEDIRAGIKEF